MARRKIAGLLLMLFAISALGVYFFMLIKGKAILVLTLVVSFVVVGVFSLIFWVGFILVKTKEPKILENDSN